MPVLLYLIVLAFAANLPLNAQSVVRGPVLHMLSDTAITVKWRTDSPTTSKVSFGKDGEQFTKAVVSASNTTEHELRLTDLTPNTRYTYALGNTTGILASSPSMVFTTAPETGAAKPTRIWVIGDAGTGSTSQKQVRDAYYRYPGAADTDLFLTVGDNAYSVGSEAEFQSYHFNIYEDILKRSSHAPAFGNHDGYTGAGDAHPFFQLFSFPTLGQVGGVASNAKGYYSFNYGNIHFITLDSFESSTAAGSPMMTWLAADLLANQQPWTIVYFHHSPYSRGSHDSDQDAWMTAMRRDVLPLLERHGVDLVLGGHSHTYERGGLVNGHYGFANTYQSSMSVDNSLGREDVAGPYRKAHYGKSPNAGAVYVVAGTSGQVTSRTGLHPAHLISSLDSGSLILDISGERLDATFLTGSGTIGDYFTLIKGHATGAKPASISLHPIAQSPLYQNQNFHLKSTTSSGVIQVEYFDNGRSLGIGTQASPTNDWPLTTQGLTNSMRISAKATHQNGQVSYSAPLSLSLYPNTGPSAATLLLNGVDSYPTPKVSLSINLGSGYLTRAELYRAHAQSSQFSMLATLDPNSRNQEYLDQAVRIGERYDYQVRLANTVGSSDSANLSVAVPTRGVTSNVDTQVLINPHSQWRYWDKGALQSTATSTWMSTDFDDASWLLGQAEFGYGDGNENTVVDFGGNPANKHPTTYFRKQFIVTNTEASGLLLSIRVDDGAVVYLNGREVARVRMPTAALNIINYNTMADLASDDGNEWQHVRLPIHLLRSGMNVVAVEVHQNSIASSDISFDLILQMGLGASPEQKPVTLSYAGNTLSAQVIINPYRNHTLLLYRNGVLLNTRKLKALPQPLVPDHSSESQYQFVFNALRQLITQSLENTTIQFMINPNSPGNYMVMYVDDRMGQHLSNVVKVD